MSRKQTDFSQNRTIHNYPYACCYALYYVYVYVHSLRKTLVIHTDTISFTLQLRLSFGKPTSPRINKQTDEQLRRKHKVQK